MNSKLNAPIAPWPYFEEDEKQAALDVLNSGKVNYWTGTVCRKFEKEFAKYAGRKYGIALANGSLALELALIAYDIGPGDEVIVTCRSFVASASCVNIRGAIPVFADVDLDSQDILPKSIENKITSKTKAIICVHLAGWPCDMDKINAIAKKHNLKVIEDCAQAHGAKYRGKPVGSLGDVAAFSFCQDKIMTCGGEGGIFLCDDEEIYKRCWSYTEHGKNISILDNPNNPVVIDSFGTNWRMTEMQAAIGLCQLKKLNDWVEIRRATYSNLFKKIQRLYADSQRKAD
ncbi:MAG: DegT/DnrJ/EryC1/StrS family aminotransferase [Candidatus Riflebacteria bacterium]|nr:DegT/DnrJ/EryC1/StrS family aminotransferase [Candidatus Riflebacteria bacterium]